jgi:tetratricopeptide (TPR) repeat protein
MKTKSAVILIVVASLISIVLMYLIVSGIKTNEQRTHSEEVVLEKATTPPTPAVQAAPAQPVVTKDQVIALFNARTQVQQKKAIEAFKKAMRDVPPYVGTGTKGYPVALNGQYEKAALITQTEITENPTLVDPRYTLAWIYARTGSDDKAVAVCNDALQLGPSFNKMRYILGWVQAKQGKYDDALKTCDDALRIDPYSAMFYYAKGRIQDLIGRNNEAIASYLKAVELKNDYAEAYVFLGLLYTELGRYDDAIAAQKQAVSFNRYGPAGYLGLGLAYDEKGNYQAAWTQLNNAVTLGAFGTDAASTKQPLTLSIGIDDAVIYNRIGILNVRLGNYQDALMAFNNAVAARPDYADPYRGLVLTYLLQGNKELALKNYDKLKGTDAELANSVAGLVGEGK